MISLLAGLFGLEVRTRQSYLVWCVLFGLLLASIAVRRSMRLEGVRVHVDAPKLVSVEETITFRVRLTNEGDRHHQTIRVTGPLLPWDGQYESQRQIVDSLLPKETTEISITAKFSARGDHHLDPFVASTIVPFGLVSSPMLGSRGVRFLVVPKIAPVVRLRTPRVRRYQPGGVALASQTGESMEILGLRPYRPGDPIRDLHAKRWARLGAPVVREYQQEYFTRIGVVIDTDMRALDEEGLEAGLSLAAGVLAHLSRGDALIDLLVVGQELHQLTLGRSLGFLDQALELLAVVEPGPQFDAETLSRRITPHLRQLSCVVFVSLDWDPHRQGFTERIIRRGVGCRVLQVTKAEDRDIGATDGGDITQISRATIRRSGGHRSMSRRARCTPALALALTGVGIGLNTNAPALAGVLALLSLSTALLPRSLRLGRAAEVILGLFALLTAWVVAVAITPEDATWYSGKLTLAFCGIGLSTFFIALTRLIIREAWGGYPTTALFSLITWVSTSTASGGVRFIVLGVLYIIVQLVAINQRDPSRRSPRHMSSTHRKLSLVAALIAALVSTTFALILPPSYDWTVRSFGLRFFGARSGFSTRLSLGSMSGLLQSDDPVLRIYGARPDHLRGIVYTQYQRGRWTTSRRNVAGVIATPFTADRLEGETEIWTIGGRKRRYFVPLDAVQVQIYGGAARADTMGIFFPTDGDVAEILRFRRGSRREHTPLPPLPEDRQVPKVC